MSLYTLIVFEYNHLEIFVFQLENLYREGLFSFFSPHPLMQKKQTSVINCNEPLQSVDNVLYNLDN